MPHIPDLSDPRYLEEVGWFLYHEKHRRDKFGGCYDAERRAYSRLLLNEVADYLDRDAKWIEDKTVVSIGCGCTGDLTMFPAAVKIAIDPLLYTYQKLGMLVGDEVGTHTVYLSMSAEDLPLLDDCADLVICRNSLDHMPNPAVALKEMWRILNNDGALFISVDLGGEPTPDEPTVFSVESLSDLLVPSFQIVKLVDSYPPHSVGRVCSLRIVARKKHQVSYPLDKEKILRTYQSHMGNSKSV
jgi:SAM-dependent methyltransferase